MPGVPRQTRGHPAKLQLGRVDDPLEREADRAADVAVQRTQAAFVRPAPIVVWRLPSPNAGEAGTAPDSVARAMAAPGRAMDPAVRVPMEQRFGRRFDRVRVHTDGEAADSARAIGARAYTYGTDVAFAAGEYRPDSAPGQRLLAHELAHVAQHAGGATRIIQRKPASKDGAPISATELRPATPEERREFARIAAEFLRGQGDHFALQPDRDLAEIIGHLNTTAENALAAVSGDAGATVVAEGVRSAYRDAVRTALVARTQSRPDMLRTPPTLQELYEEQRDAILPFGLPQARADIGADELSAELSAPLPDEPTREQRTRHAAVTSARQRLRVVTTPVDISIDDLFSTQGGTTTVALPENTSARLGSTVPSSLHRGLTSVAGQLMESALAANTTVMLALDLTPYGGSYDAYRFTRLDLGTLGTEVLIERQGAIGVEGLRTEQRQALQERFDRLGFQRGTGFGADEFDQVLIGLGEMPETSLAALGNLRFERQADDPAHPDAAAHYDQSAHTVRVFDRAFAGGSTRLGRGGRALQYAALAVIHEVGHAHDLGALRTAGAATATAQAAVLAEFGTGGTGYRIPGSGRPIGRGSKSSTAR